MVIDTHAHIIVPEVTRPSRDAGGWQPYVHWENGQQVIEFAGKVIKSAIFEFIHIEKILEAQANAGVDRFALCPWVNLLRYQTPPQEGLDISRVQNESLSRLAQQYTQISALGTVPLQDPELAARELEQVMQTPGLQGVEIAASVNNVYLGDDRFRPFWDAAEATGALVFIHPTTRGFDAPVFNDYYLWNAVGNPLENTITAAHMILSGVMETHPRLKVLLAHGGGAILSLRGRLQHAHSFQPQAKSRLHETPIESLKRFYLDTLVHDPDVLRELIQFAGPDHVVVGSDYPFDMGDAHPAAIVRSLNLSSDDEEKILSGNVTRLLYK
jgi:aminocarboxymuconate-semialdehyde decarboxylase